ncbi:unnamed protein product [Rhizophagus irregularis]|uniref:Uncharacterized protein n=1 Tax=Rhizophagus irregularis TaxID=588596 RepID=A0A2I1GU27_9GLOM|nr:hypothetical protein RhiirA4_466334 [Rhizophagus irregularis]CAB4414526.1 unnamed protein product [Rhizophagus irregularis]
MQFLVKLYLKTPQNNTSIIYMEHYIPAPDTSSQDTSFSPRRQTLILIPCKEHRHFSRYMHIKYAIATKPLCILRHLAYENFFAFNNQLPMSAQTIPLAENNISISLKQTNNRSHQIIINMYRRHQIHSHRHSKRLLYTYKLPFLYRWFGQTDKHK